MVGHELAIEQFKSAQPEPCNKPRQRDLRRISLTREHAFAEKSPSQGKPVKPANKASVQPTFDAMGTPLRVQPTKGVLNVGVNPGVPPVGLRLCTGGDNLGKGRVGGDDEAVLPDGFGKRLRQTETIQWHDGAKLWFNPKGVRVITGVGHREYAIGVGLKQ